MPARDEPRCETCERFSPHDNNATGTCNKDGAKEDRKGTCYWHTEKEKERRGR